MEDKQIEPKMSTDQLLEVIESLNMDFDNPSIVQDNKLIYFYEGKMYRVTMPSQYDRAMAEEKKNQLYVKLIQSGKYLTKKQLRDILIEKQGIDIEGLEAKQVELMNKRKELYFKLAPKMTEEKEEIVNLKQQIEDVKREHMMVSLELYNYLSPSIEDTMDKEYVEYLTYKCSQVSTVENKDPKSDNDWEDLWNTYEDFQSETDKICEVAVKAMGDLLILTRD